MKEFKIGRLGQAPQKKNVRLPDGRTLNVVNVTLFVRGVGGKANENKDIPIYLTAWAGAAERLAGFEKGALIGVMGSTKVKMSKDGEISYGLSVSSVYEGDAALNLRTEINALLQAFEAGKIDHIFDSSSQSVVTDLARSLGMDFAENAPAFEEENEKQTSKAAREDESKKSSDILDEMAACASSIR